MNAELRLRVDGFAGGIDTADGLHNVFIGYYRWLFRQSGARAGGDSDRLRARERRTFLIPVWQQATTLLNGGVRVRY
jgi:hypothetical protein